MLLTAVAVLPAFVILVASQLSYRSTRSAEIDVYASRMTDVVMTEVIRGMTGAATMTVAAGRAVLTAPMSADLCSAYLGGLQRDFPAVIDMVVAGPDRAIACHSGPSDVEALQRHIDQIAAKTTPGLWVGTYEQTPSGPALPIGIALQSEGGGTLGFVALNAGVLDLQKLVVGASVPASSSTVVTDGNGTILLAVPGDALKPGDAVPEALRPFAFAPERGAVRAPDPSGRASIIGYRPSTAQFPLAAVFMLPEAEMMAPVDRDGWTISAIAVAGAVLAFALALFIGARFIAAPVRALHGAVAARRAGDRTARTGLQHDNSELGLIATATDALFDELDQREAAQAKAELQRDIYAREVQHRVKNLLGIIQVTARQSLLRGEPPPAVKALEGRINAIVRANAKLVAENQTAGGLKEILRESAAPFLGDDPNRIALDGPDLALRSKPALALAMAVHELCTNALKYGALSQLEGRVEISWLVEGDQLQLTWTETDGPPVEPPQLQGFGTVLITRILEGETKGKVELDYAVAGLRFKLSAPMDALMPYEQVV